jgi:hypothetical protein
MDYTTETETETKQDKKKQYHADYYKNNRERLLSNNKTKKECELCGSVLTKNAYTKHFNSQRCQKIKQRKQFIELHKL